MAATKEFGKEEITDMVCSMWEPLSAAQRRLIGQHLSFKQFKKNEMIFKEDEQPFQMMCLVQGKVKIFKEGMGRCQIVRVVKPQEMFGYSAFFAHGCYKTNAMAFEPSVVAFIPMSIVTQLSHEHRHPTYARRSWYHPSHCHPAVNSVRRFGRPHHQPYAETYPRAFGRSFDDLERPLWNGR